MALVKLLGETLKTKDGVVSTAEALKGKQAVALYFSAHWCPPCRGFTPKLAQIYKGLVAAGKSFEIVFVSSDREEPDFDSYFGEQPWLALPYAERKLKAALGKKYEVSGIPSLIILDGETGEVITKDGREAVMEDPEGERFPWKPPSLWEALGDEFMSGDGESVELDALRGEGKVIGGWEVGLSSMAVGEMCTLTCTPQYANGAKGIPPMIPPSATLSFEVELLGATPPAEVQSRTLADDNPDAPRTPQAIQQAYAQKMAAKPAQQEGLAGLLEWAKGIYIFGFFAGDKGERPPWYLNPLITFPAIFAVVGLGFYLVVELGGVHRGTPAPIGDDLRGFLDETPLP